MKVRLLKDVMDGGALKTCIRKNRPTVAFVAGAVVEASEGTAQKWIAAGLAEEVNEEPAEDAA